MSSIQQKLSSLLFFLGALVFLSALIINPWLGMLYRRRMINYQDVMLDYFVWAVAIGLVLVGCGFVFRIAKSSRSQNVTILFVTCLFIVLFDRLVLAMFARSLWMTDVENHYQHRPNVVKSWGGSGKLIRINQYGHHDDNFPLRKAPNEFRAVMLGDSITMGHGVTHQETFSNQLENMLNEKASSAKTYQIINTGFQGYSTYQEYNMLLRSLAFNPDFIAIGFCMNDLTEPFVVDKRFGGLGIDYHHVAQASSRLTGYLFNETGYGRGIQILRSLITSLERRKRWEASSISKIAQSPASDPRFRKNWQMVLSYLNQIYDVGRRENIRVALLIFPFTFQFMNDEFKNPQKILTEHSIAGNVDVIDFTAVFERKIFDAAVVSGLREKGLSGDEIRALYRPGIKKYFMDADHFTPEGHRVVASRLFEYLSSRYSLSIEPD